MSDERKQDSISSMDSASLSGLIVRASAELGKRQERALRRIFDSYEVTIPKPDTSTLRVKFPDCDWETAGKMVHECGKLLSDSGATFNIHTVGSISKKTATIQIVVSPLPKFLEHLTLLDENDELDKKQLTDLLNQKK